MQGTREHILDYIVRRREARVEELSEALGITPAAVRRHLDHLRADGLVDLHAVRQATGRPYYVYTATELAIGVLPAPYEDLLARMFHGLDERQDVAALVMTTAAESLASRHRGEIGAAALTPAARVAQVTVSLKQEGILESWHAEDDGLHLVNGTCPYRKAAEISRLPCESDRKAIELLIGSEVEQINRIVDGARFCEYLVREPGTSPEPSLAEAAEGVS